MYLRWILNTSTVTYFTDEKTFGVVTMFMTLLEEFSNRIKGVIEEGTTTVTRHWTVIVSFVTD